MGAYLTNLANSGLDVTVTDSRMDGGSTGSYASWYASVGRRVGARVYLTGDVSSSVSVLQFTTSGGFIVDTRPRTRRYSVSSTINVTRPVSLLVTVERVAGDSYSEVRVLSGVIYRF